MSLAVIGLAAASVIAITYAVLSALTARRAERDLHRATTHDHLTGLPNRTVLESVVKDELDRARSRGERLSLVAIELNRFASVNETYGYEVGDALMIEAGRQLTKALRPGEHLVRYGGPQFVVVSSGATDSGAALRRARELQAAVEVPYKIGSDDFKITAGVGVASIGDRDDRGRDIVGDALFALGEANYQGPGRAALFDPSMRGRLSALSTERRLSEALDRGEFWLLYLPVVALDTGEIVGVEALLRWGDPSRGMIAPSQFLGALDRTGLIVPVGAWVIGEACRQSASWSQRFPDRELVMTVNVSQRQLAQPDFLGVVLDAVHDSGIEPERLCLEISEATLTSDADVAWTALRQTKEAGIKLALDDFGVGFSSLGHLKRFQLDVLKIDRTFITGLGADRDDEAIVQQLVGLAHGLGLVPVAEGVETPEQAHALQSLRCDFAQGYWFSEPQPPDTVARMIERGKVTPGGDRRAIDWTGGPTAGQPSVADRSRNSSGGAGGANR